MDKTPWKTVQSIRINPDFGCQANTRFSPSNFTCEPNSQSLISKINELDKDYDVYRNTALKLGEKYKKKFNKKSIAENIINIFNLR